MRNKKEVTKRQKAKKQRKNQARKLKKKRARQQEANLETRKIDISSSEEWSNFINDNNVKKTPYYQMTVFPLQEQVLGRSSSPGLLSSYISTKLEMILSLMNTGEVEPDHLAVAIAWSSDDSMEMADKGEDGSLDATSLMGFPIKEMFESGVISFQNLEEVGQSIEESVRDAAALQEERCEVQLQSFGIWFTPVSGPFRESAIWKKMAKNASKRRKGYLVQRS